jgi:hypothetical protein
LPRLAWNYDLSDLSLDYRHEPPAPSSQYSLLRGKDKSEVVVASSAGLLIFSRNIRKSRWWKWVSQTVVEMIQG